jgi:hypothetical protein
MVRQVSVSILNHCKYESFSIAFVFLSTSGRQRPVQSIGDESNTQLCNGRVAMPLAAGNRALRMRRFGHAGHGVGDRRIDYLDRDHRNRCGDHLDRDHVDGDRLDDDYDIRRILGGSGGEGDVLRHEPVGVG